LPPGFHLGLYFVIINMESTLAMSKVIETQD
jgi:hypothetical protein